MPNPARLHRLQQGDVLKHVLLLVPQPVMLLDARHILCRESKGLRAPCPAVHALPIMKIQSRREVAIAQLQMAEEHPESIVCRQA